MAKKVSKKTKPKAKPDMLWAILSYFGLWFFPLWLIKPRNKFSEFHAKQGLMLFIAWAVLWVAGFILALIPTIGRFVTFVLDITLFVLWLIGVIHAAKGETKELPLIGKYSDVLLKNI